MRTRGPWRFAAALGFVSVLALTACESSPQDGPDAPDVPETAATPDSQADAGQTDAGQTGAESDADTDAGQVIEAGAAPPAGGVALLTPAPVREPAIDDDPQQLYGLDAGSLGALLGEPSLVRNEAPAEIWQYRSKTCVFDIFLYQGADQPRVTYIEARDDAAQRIDARACLNEILRARKGLPPLG